MGKNKVSRMTEDSYTTLKGMTSSEIKVKGSRFIGYATTAGDKQEAESFIGEISRKHHDATHNCFVYRIGIGDRAIFRYSDDGEPSGTAGKPILEAIDGRELTHIVCVVTRYFGGTKRGTGGLARAYGECAAKTLDRGDKIKKYITQPLRIVYEYDLTGVVMGLVSDYDCKIESTHYKTDTEMTLSVRLSLLERFRQALIDATAGKVKILGEEVKHP